MTSESAPRTSHFVDNCNAAAELARVRMEEVRLMKEMHDIREALALLRDGELSGTNDTSASHTRRVVMVSYDLPEFSSNSWTSHMGTHSAISGALSASVEDFEHTWVGSVPADDLNPRQRSLLRDEYVLQGHEPVFAHGDMFHNHYFGFCKGVLWPLLHNEAPTSVYSLNIASVWDAYVHVNQVFVEHILRVYRPDSDIIWVLDYHLFLVPYLLRESLPDAIIGFSLQTPFPPSELFRILPYRNHILQGMLAADLIGFQSYSYARQFMFSCSRVLGLDSFPDRIECGDGHTAHMRIVPCGIDLELMKSNLEIQSIDSACADIRSQHKGKTLLFSVDNMTRTKGISHKLSAYELFLEKHPELNGQVVLVQVVLRVRSNPSEYLALEEQVNELVGQINGKYGNVDSQPVQYITRALRYEDVFAMLCTSDVYICTPLSEGTNLVPFSYIASRDIQGFKDSTLVLSDTMGVFVGATGPLSINPWSTTEFADSIYKAVTMPSEERSRRHQEMMPYVISCDARANLHIFLSTMVSLGRNDRTTNRVEKMAHLELSALKSCYRQSTARLLVFDYDGTLVQHRSQPESAVLSAVTMANLVELASDPNNHVLILSGRTRANMDDWFGETPCALAAEHGAFLKRGPGEDWENLCPPQSMDSWWADVLTIMTHFTERTPGSFIESKEACITWHFFDADVEFGEWQSKQLQNHLAAVLRSPHSILVNESKTVEVRHHHANKRNALRRFCQGSYLMDFDFVMGVGDDRGDEPIFKFLTATYSDDAFMFQVRVGQSDRGAARYYLDSVKEVHEMINFLASDQRRCSSFTSLP